MDYIHKYNMEKDIICGCGCEFYYFINEKDNFKSHLHLYEGDDINLNLLVFDDKIRTVFRYNAYVDIDADDDGGYIGGLLVTLNIQEKNGRFSMKDGGGKGSITNMLVKIYRKKFKHCKMIQFSPCNKHMHGNNNGSYTQENDYFYIYKQGYESKDMFN